MDRLFPLFKTHLYSININNVTLINVRYMSMMQQKWKLLIYKQKRERIIQDHINKLRTYSQTPTQR